MSTRSILLTLIAPVVFGMTACSGPNDAGAAQSLPSVDENAPLVVVYKSPTCGCCTQWEDHMRANGFRVESHLESDMNRVKHEHRITAGLASCHTAVVDGYVVEGHVPAEAVEKLLAQRPDVDGISVPGMPAGSPGMEIGYVEPYEVVTFKDGKPLEIFAAY